MQIFDYFSRAKVKKHNTNTIDLKKKILNILKYTAFTALGILMFWLVYRDQDFSAYWERLKHDVNYYWVAVSLLLGVLSHISRTLRWKIALEPLGEHPKTSNTFIAVMVSYLMNLLLPRMGEFVRCGLMTKYEKIPFAKLFGTVVTERIVDMIMLLLMTLIVAIFNFEKLVDLVAQNPELVANIKRLATSPVLWSGFVVLILAVFLYIRHLKKSGHKNKISQLIDGFIEGIKSVLSMKRYKAYIAHSVFIWLMYFLMLYMIFFSLDFTKELGVLAALTTFVMASFGMIAPTQGGMGAWHIMAALSLNLFGVELSDGKFFAFLAHESTNLLVVVLGSVLIALMPFLNRGYKGNSSQTSQNKIS
jgi:uncharacterized protein (TIRG00374 family)